LDFDFEFCEALYLHENFVDDVDDWDLDSDIENDFSAIDRQKFFKDVFVIGQWIRMYLGTVSISS
jgi:hypothetical protein